MSFPRYPEYKDSGVEWLGEVPEHWEVVRLNTIVTCNDEVLLESTPEDYEIEYVEISGVQAGQGIVETAALPFGNAPSRARRVVRDGDVLISTVRTYLRAIAQVKCPPENMIASTGFAVLRPRRIDSGFLGYACHAEGFVSEVIARSVGVSYPAINSSELTRLPLPLPTTPEQTAIATFLDHETAKIDALVAEQEKLIALLQEKRQAVISHAVTKGLDPSVTMKDSGVEWLGEVPEHWEVKQLRHIAKIVRGASPRPAGDPKFFTSEAVIGQTTPWVTVAEITKDAEIYLRDVKEYLTVLGAESSQFFPSGTLVFTNSGATLGVPKVLAIDCCANDGVLAFRDLSTSIDILFAYHFLSTTTDRLRTEMKQGGGQPNLNTDIVKNIGIALPPRDEQDAIVGYLASENTKFVVLVTEARSAITLLQERRTALISAAVTGQIDVRGLVGNAHAPDSIAASAYPASA